MNGLGRNVGSSSGVQGPLPVTAEGRKRSPAECQRGLKREREKRHEDPHGERENLQLEEVAAERAGPNPPPPPPLEESRRAPSGCFLPGRRSGKGGLVRARATSLSLSPSLSPSRRDRQPLPENSQGAPWLGTTRKLGYREPSLVQQQQQQALSERRCCCCCRRRNSTLRLLIPAAFHFAREAAAARGSHRNAFFFPRLSPCRASPPTNPYRLLSRRAIPLSI